eukprot:TRINITY_DN1849_c0_g2_i1.p1 TRINITY_DN1849_c0_g2~~TRINITY_DN1849_c0_g2_i1.p1  ORF type:complete len:707 (+),score=194.90 TRINITY_DN1849_c0_g2_i1:95-2122(+)
MEAYTKPPPPTTSKPVGVRLGSVDPPKAKKVAKEEKEAKKEEKEARKSKEREEKEAKRAKSREKSRDRQRSKSLSRDRDRVSLVSKKEADKEHTEREEEEEEDGERGRRRSASGGEGMPLRKSRSSVSASTAPSRSFSKIRSFTVFLPGDTKKVTIFKEDMFVQELLTGVCVSRGLALSKLKVCLDEAGTIPLYDFSRTLGSLNTLSLFCFDVDPSVSGGDEKESDTEGYDLMGGLEEGENEDEEKEDSMGVNETGDGAESVPVKKPTESITMSADSSSGEEDEVKKGGAVECSDSKEEKSNPTEDSDAVEGDKENKKEETGEKEAKDQTKVNENQEETGIKPVVEITSAPVAGASAIGDTKPRCFTVYLPDDHKKVSLYNGDATLRRFLDKVCLTRGLSLSDYSVEDLEGNPITHFDQTLDELGLADVRMDAGTRTSSRHPGTASADASPDTSDDVPTKVTQSQRRKQKRTLSVKGKRRNLGAYSSSSGKKQKRRMSLDVDSDSPKKERKSAFKSRRNSTDSVSTDGEEKPSEKMLLTKSLPAHSFPILTEAQITRFKLPPTVTGGTRLHQSPQPRDEGPIPRPVPDESAVKAGRLTPLQVFSLITSSTPFPTTTDCQVQLGKVPRSRESALPNSLQKEFRDQRKKALKLGEKEVRMTRKKCTFSPAKGIAISC